MKRNTLLQRDAMDRLEVEPSVNAPKFGVMANGGIVVLTGNVSSCAEKYPVSEAAVGTEFYAGLLYASAIAVALWLTVGGVVWWVTR